VTRLLFLTLPPIQRFTPQPLFPFSLILVSPLSYPWFLFSARFPEFDEHFTRTFGCASISIEPSGFSFFDLGRPVLAFHFFLTASTPFPPVGFFRPLFLFSTVF